MDTKLGTSLGITLLAFAGVGFSAGALATDRTPGRNSAATSPAATNAFDSHVARRDDHGQVVPDKADLTPFKPSVSVLDDNTQRAHDREQGATPRSPGGESRQIASGGTRDWKVIDQNHDNLISPDEMQRYLDGRSWEGQKKQQQ